MRISNQPLHSKQVGCLCCVDLIKRPHIILARKWVGLKPGPILNVEFVTLKVTKTSDRRIFNHPAPVFMLPTLFRSFNKCCLEDVLLVDANVRALVKRKRKYKFLNWQQFSTVTYCIFLKFSDHLWLNKLLCLWLVVNLFLSLIDWG